MMNEEKLAQFCKALAHPVRVRIIRILAAEGRHPPADFRKQISRSQFEVVVVDVRHALLQNINRGDSSAGAVDCCQWSVSVVLTGSRSSSTRG